jgi:hypothetical protein
MIRGSEFTVTIYIGRPTCIVIAVNAADRQFREDGVTDGFHHVPMPWQKHD